MPSQMPSEQVRSLERQEGLIVLERGIGADEAGEVGSNGLAHEGLHKQDEAIRRAALMSFMAQLSCSISSIHATSTTSWSKTIKPLTGKSCLLALQSTAH
jgi:hypothetical protein